MLLTEFLQLMVLLSSCPWYLFRWLSWPWSSGRVAPQAEPGTPGSVIQAGGTVMQILLAPRWDIGSVGLFGYLWPQKMQEFGSLWPQK